MLIDVPPTLLNTMMHNKHLSHLMAKSMNELAHKSPLNSSRHGVFQLVLLLTYICVRFPALSFST